MNSKIVSTKITSAIFLAIVLVTGTIALSSTSLMRTNVAQAEPYYETDDYTTYAMDMANEYVDEYKSSSYSNDNNNYKSQNSDSIKKIKCNNINSNINGLENITDVNGLLGIGDAAIQGDEERKVSATNAFGNGERTNGNFDVDCINNNDNTGIGPAGPRGLQGPQGPAGPPSIIEINSKNFYTVQGSGAIIPETGTFAIDRASCDAGDTAISGGYTTFGPTGFPTATTFTQEDIDTWITEIMGIGGQGVLTSVHCFDNLPLHS